MVVRTRAAIGLTLTILACGPALAGQTSLVSVGPGGRQGNGDSDSPNVSATGRRVVFASRASNLVNGDSNRRSDVFVVDVLNKRTSLVSRGQDGRDANGDSFEPALSRDGTITAFYSSASNLIRHDTNGSLDVFVAGASGAVERVSVASDEGQGNGDSRYPSISSNGRFVAFASRASNLVPKDTNGAYDIFVRDRERRVTERVSLGGKDRQGSGGSLDAYISGDGRYVAFSSDSSNIVGGDSNKATDVFVRDRRLKVTRRVSVRNDGGQANGPSYPLAISANGRYVLFSSTASNLVAGDGNGMRDVFVRDLQARRTERVSVPSNGGGGNRASDLGTISDDGRFVAFRSMATNLVPKDTNRSTDIFLRDRRTKRTTRLSTAPGGGQSNAGCFDAAISADGSTVVLACDASNIVTGDRNGHADIFSRKRVP